MDETERPNVELPAAAVPDYLRSARSFRVSIDRVPMIRRPAVRVLFSSTTQFTDDQIRMTAQL